MVRRNLEVPERTAANGSELVISFEPRGAAAGKCC
jgi:hypothetical protein